MYNLNFEETAQVLEIGMEKLAQDAAVEEYVDALEKVSFVHEVDPEELHEFLEKQAAAEDFVGPKAKGFAEAKRKVHALGSNVKGLPTWAKATGTAAGVAAMGGAGYGAYKALKRRKEVEKTASAFDMDPETFETIFNAGLEALSEMDYE